MWTDKESIQDLSKYSKDIVIFALMMANIVLIGTKQGKMSEDFAKYLKVLNIPITPGTGKITFPIFDLNVANDITFGCGDFESAVYEAKRIGINTEEYDLKLKEELFKIYQVAIEDSGYVGDIPKKY